ncbi:hypothetical protein EOD40_08005 [Flavobacterium sufflavum]|uniref:Uncharacterized protein n=1 Tax=Flavobacterium sufflavum TaxID=1921138 RepID=A0A437KVL4_9FLAO|nr:hypothetical protein [Flavobacterium sufflavum]RVT76441.1 hypothetical protein EOD40_08005 [Flavobacterium sufflavum]
MNTEIPNNDYRDWILFYGVDNKNFVFDISKHSDFINSLDEIGKARFKLALKEMLLNNTLTEHKKDKLFLLTSLGKFISENGGFTSINLQTNSELNINEKFSKNLEINKQATYITVGVSIITMFILGLQTFLQTQPSIVKIDTEPTLTKTLELEVQETNTILRHHYQPLKDSLKKELHIQSKK